MPQTSSTYTLKLSVPHLVSMGEGRALERDDFLAWLWEEFGERGLIGIHEGTVLSEQAAERGLETESFTIDAAEAPRERDWIGAQGEAEVELYFSSENEARVAQNELRNRFTSIAPGNSALLIGSIAEQKPQDWDAEWKKSFLNNTEGVFIAPFWRILPSWVDPAASIARGERPLLINPGAGFGTGTHETTQLCLQAIGEIALGRGARHFQDTRVLDFGSGSGILAIGAALLGATVDAVEIDELAIDNAKENARINRVEPKIHYSKFMVPERSGYPLVIANILRPVLVEFAPELVTRMAPGGHLILSGLVQADVSEIDRVFSALLGSRPRVSERGEWRGMVWGE